jgi:hypothetical protein
VKLLIRREVKAGGQGKLAYTFHARAQLTDAETALIHTNKLSGEFLLHFAGSTDGSGSAGALLRVMRDLTIKKLMEGTTFHCDHLSDLRAIEGHVLQAAKNLKHDLATALTLGSETLIDIDEILRQEEKPR